MNRQIKFRGLKSDGTGWVYGDFTTRCPFPVGIYDDEGLHEVDPETAGQFTGLPDKNGKEIFEGDLVDTPTLKNQIVKYENSQACFVTKSEFVDFENPDPDEMLWDWAWLEITGNIHEITTETT